MMIEVIVSHSGPLDGGHGTEKAVRMGCALFRSSRRKAVNAVEQTPLLPGELPLIIPDQAFIRGHISAERPFA